jgi:hypothetical protein
MTAIVALVDSSCRQEFIDECCRCRRSPRLLCAQATLSLIDTFDPGTPTGVQVGIRVGLPVCHGRRACVFCGCVTVVGTLVMLLESLS